MRLIDADALKERLEQISVVADDWYGMGINRGLDRADTAIDLMPTVDIKTEVAKEIFAEIEKKLDKIMVIVNPDDCFITTFRKTMAKVKAGIDELENKYTKKGVGE